MVLTVMLSQCVGGGRSIRTAHGGGRLSNSLSGFCLSLNVQPCSGQSGSEERGQERSLSGEEAVNGPYVAQLISHL